MELKKVLYVEDEEDIQTIVKMALELEDIDLKICNNGKEALEVVENFQPDIILLDVMMPEMDGPTTFRNLKEMPQVNQIPVVFMTARTQTSEVQQYLDLGAVGVITKPFDPVGLFQQIQDLWGKHAN